LQVVVTVPRQNCRPTREQPGFAAAEEQFQQLTATPRGRLKPISRLSNQAIDTWMHSIPALKMSLHGTNPLLMHPQDACERRLYKGDDVNVRSSAGSIGPSG
jgi:anaerobic selenocysteine-containing dehydrogenase